MLPFPIFSLSSCFSYFSSYRFLAAHTSFLVLELPLSLSLPIHFCVRLFSSGPLTLCSCLLRASRFFASPLVCVCPAPLNFTSSVSASYTPFPVLVLHPPSRSPISRHSLFRPCSALSPVGYTISTLSSVSYLTSSVHASLVSAHLSSTLLIASSASTHALLSSRPYPVCPGRACLSLSNLSPQLSCLGLLDSATCPVCLYL